MEVKIKKLVESAVIPFYAKPGDAGMDLTAVSKWYEDGNVCYGTGLAFEIPEGYVGLVFPRSSNAKKDLILSNCVGVIDSGYRGEVTFKFKPNNKIFAYETNNDKKDCRIFDVDNEEQKIYDINERVGQIIILPFPKIKFIESEELSETERGTGGYGSTNN